MNGAMPLIALEHGRKTIPYKSARRSTRSRTRPRSAAGRRRRRRRKPWRGPTASAAATGCATTRPSARTRGREDAAVPRLDGALRRAAGRAAVGDCSARCSAPRSSRRATRNLRRLDAHEGQPAVADAQRSARRALALLFEAGVGRAADRRDVRSRARQRFERRPSDAASAPTALEMRMIREVARDARGRVVRGFRAGRRFRSRRRNAADDRGRRAARREGHAGAAGAGRDQGAGRRLRRHAAAAAPVPDALAAAFARGPAPGAAKLDPVWSSRMERRVTEAQPDADRRCSTSSR